MSADGLKVAGVLKAYGDRPVLKGVDMVVRPGQVLGFVGANGSGKTTTMRVILGLLRPDAGSVLWNGFPLARRPRPRIGYMPEERGLYPKMRLQDQLTMLARLHGMDETAASASTSEWLCRLGLQDRRHDQVDELSLGNQQRAQIAAALVHQPDLLVLDEPFSGLDPIGMEELRAVLLEQAARGLPVVFSSHQLDIMEGVCDSVAILRDGRTVLQTSLITQQQVRPRLRIQVDDVDHARICALPGVGGVTQVFGDGDHVYLVDLSDDSAIQPFLHQLHAITAIHHFSRARIRIADLFKEAMST